MLSIVIALAVFAGACSAAPESFWPTIEDYPSLVQVERFDSLISTWRPFSGGTIISNSFVISYAQYFHREFDSLYYPEFRRIRAGTTYSNRGGVISNVASALTHPDYLSDAYYDLTAGLCIVRLRDLLPFGPTIRSVPIPPQDWELPVGSEVAQAGWGETPVFSIPYNEIHDNTATTLEHDVCYDRYTRISNDTICSGFNTNNTWVGRCAADYGGPLYYGGTAVGVYIFGGCTISSRPTVSTKVSAYTDWIVTNTN